MIRPDALLNVQQPLGDVLVGLEEFALVVAVLRDAEPLAPRVALASFAAFIVGSLINAYVMSRMKVRDRGRRFPLRAIMSTVWGEGADSLLFFPLAFYGVLPNEELPLMMLSQLVLKTLYEVMALPVTVRVVRWVKTCEGEDIYDRNTDYSIFAIFKKT